jgi:Xaa-Pro aminopeptidase
MKLCYAHLDENAIYYECLYSCENSIFLSLENENFFFTDSRYEIEAYASVKGAKVIITSNILDEMISILKNNNIINITLDEREWKYFHISKLQKENININFQSELSHKKREIKSKDEIQKLSKAVNIGADGFNKFEKEIKFLDRSYTEKDLSFLNLSCMSDYGKFETSFDAIVAINENSAKPHCIAGNKILKINDVLLVDAGIKYERYCSDRTRTLFYNDDFKFDTNIIFDDIKKQKIYDIVLKAHNLVIENFKYGMKACDLDTIARAYICDSGFGKYFTHSLGHGVGLDIHEKPYISVKNQDMIKESMVFTIEPGIYIKDFLGVRIENMFVVKNEKLVIL